MSVQKNFTKRHCIYLCIILVTVSGCSSLNRVSYPPVLKHKAPPASSADSQYDKTLKAMLMRQYIDWHTTPYKLGGLSKQGVDCSGLVYRTFHSKLGCKIPRTTREQVKIGSKVARKNLRTGDLVFFKTSRSTNHVGIYIGDSRFLHVSSKKGVIISTLTNMYWNKHYWTARRICKLNK